MPRSIEGFAYKPGFKPQPLTGPGLFRGQLGENGLEHEFTWMVGLDDLPAFLNYAWGWSTSTSNGTTTTTRGPRLGSPYFPGLVATGIAFEGVGANETVTKLRPYTHAKVTVGFGWLPFGTDGSQPYIDVRWRGKSTLTTVPNTNRKFANAAEYLEFDSGLWIGSVSVEVTLHQLVNWSGSLATVMGLMGKVNNAALTLDGFACPAGTILFPTFDAAKSTASMGSPQQSLTVPLEFRSLAWNKAIRSDGTPDDVQPPPYTTADFSPLLSVS